MGHPAIPSATTVFDSILFRDAFGTPAMRDVFSDYALIGRYAEVEIALARAEARCGVIPTEAAEEIAKRTDISALDFDLLREETDIVGYPILPLVHQLAKQCGDAGRYVHWGATTQDIMDTAVILQVRDGLKIIEDDINALRGILADLSRRYRDTPMAGRTHLQQALPVTFGYKTAIWLAMFDRHAERLEQLKPRVLVGEFAGAAGTLASLGDQGIAVMEALAAELKLHAPLAPWHVCSSPGSCAEGCAAWGSGGPGPSSPIRVRATPRLAADWSRFPIQCGTYSQINLGQPGEPRPPRSCRPSRDSRKCLDTTSSKS